MRGGGILRVAAAAFSDPLAGRASHIAGDPVGVYQPELAPPPPERPPPDEDEDRELPDDDDRWLA